MREPREIFEGVRYDCVLVPREEGSQGQAHVVCVDLRVKTIEPYITPLNPQAVRKGYQYRLLHPWWVAQREQLDIVINGTFFTRSDRSYWPGRCVRSQHTVIADGKEGYGARDGHLLWIDEHRQPHVHASSSSGAVPPAARWGIGSGDLVLHDGAPQPIRSDAPGRCTILGTHAERQLLWLAVFERASFAVAARVLAAAGARDALMLDGGGSTAMYISRRAPRGCRGALLGGWRPVATHVGIRAQPATCDQKRNVPT